VVTVAGAELASVVGTAAEVLGLAEADGVAEARCEGVVERPAPGFPAPRPEPAPAVSAGPDAVGAGRDEGADAAGPAGLEPSGREALGALPGPRVDVSDARGVGRPPGFGSAAGFGSAWGRGVDCGVGAGLGAGSGCGFGAGAGAAARGGTGAGPGVVRSPPPWKRRPMKPPAGTFSDAMPTWE
jgi:hypothetical protein